MKKRFLAVTFAVVLVMATTICYAPTSVSFASDGGTVELPKACLTHGKSSEKLEVDGYGNSTLKSEATCVSDAVYYQVCEKCKKKVTTKTWVKSGTKLEHDYSCEEDMLRNESTLVSAATYDSPAVYYKTCINEACYHQINKNETYEWGEPLTRYGDANDDDEIDIRDISLIARYLANYDDDTETSTISLANESAADANADGEIDIRDISLIARYLANYDDDTETSTVVLGPKE